MLVWNVKVIKQVGAKNVNGKGIKARVVGVRQKTGQKINKYMQALK